MKLIVGLGNPGSRYSMTRHNAGRLLVEYLAARGCADFKLQKNLQASVASPKLAVSGNEEVVVAYPETFMNVSGPAVLLLVKHFEIDPSKDLLVAVDDVALPFSKLRMRGRGSDGGHNGLKSIEEALGNSDYPRLRIGVGPEGPLTAGKIVLEEYVLESFLSEEKTAMPEVLERGRQACELWIAQGIDRAMNAVNA